MDVVMLVVAVVLTLTLALGALTLAATARRAFEVMRRRRAPADPRVVLRDMRRREFAEWDADFHRLGGLFEGESIVMGYPNIVPVIIDGDGRQVVAVSGEVPWHDCATAGHDPDWHRPVETETICSWDGRTVRYVTGVSRG